MKDKTLTIGIPAHNEAGNIKNLINSIYKQKNKNFVLEKVIVVCDGCTDDTASLAIALTNKYKNLVIIDDGLRMGKPERVNSLYKASRSEIFLSIDADILFSDNMVLGNIVHGFDNPKVGLVAGLSLPVKSKKFIPRVIGVGSRLWYEVRKNVNGGDTIFNLVGRITAIRKNVYKKIHFPKGMVADDEFLYVSVKQLGYRFVFVEKAIVYYKEPDNLRDFYKQSTRFLRYKQITASHFGDWVYSYYEVPKKYKKAALINMFIKEPIFLPLAVVLQTSLRFFQFLYEEDYKGSVWTTVKSTKGRITAQG